MLFEPFSSELNWQQVSLLLDTVLYFEEAPKFLSIPNLRQERVAVPLTADSLRAMLGELDEAEPLAAKRFGFSFTWTDEATQSGELLISLPSGKSIRQETDVTLFSPV
ncbi:MAG: hypothetical protein H0Z34_02870 [Brevibacillus sp.]|nr:hypothetical protein [Brevibacillus sp.]